VSIFNYINLGVSVDWKFIGSESIGVILGSFLGPYVSHFLGERRLRLVLGMILLGIGFKYIFI